MYEHRTIYNMSPLPDSVVKLLKGKRYVHLATCLHDVPHVSLMNYTYFARNDTHYVVISTPTDTTKYTNMVSNPHVLLLVHDWVANPAVGEEQGRRRNLLFELLANINTAEISSVSVMLNGEAAVVSKDSAEYGFWRSLHLNNGFIDEVQAQNYIAKDDNALVVITVTSCKVTDTNDNVEQY